MKSCQHCGHAIEGRIEADNVFRWHHVTTGQHLCSGTFAEPCP